MTSMSSIPPLIPTPAPAPKPQEKNLDEEMIDKFATLFSPPTRELNDGDGDGDSIWKTPAPSRPQQQQQQHWEPSTPDSEFGAFVSVPASEDPLAGVDADAGFSFGEGQTQGGQGHAKSPSLSFFDQFAKEAKDASERNRKEVLDELLDPLGSSWGASQPQPEHEHEHDPDSWGPPELSESLIDLDHEFFSPSSPNTGTSDRHHRRSRTVESHTHPSRHQTSPSIGTLGRSPSRSPTLSTLAPPVTSGADAQAQTQDTSSAAGRPGLSTRSTSYQTLSSISAKWMSGLISSAAATASSSTSTSTSPPQTGRGSIDSLFFSPPRTTTNVRNNGASTTTTANTTTMGAAGAPHSHSHSPFAPHMFVPGSISGAPGFAGERYDWDRKGYSNELSDELEAERSRGTTPTATSSSKGKGTPQSHSHSHSPSPRPQLQPTATMGGLIEKKSGHLELKGRRESTEGVLDGGLADKIRPHLPALSRLPKRWNLLYSLDQHGISLNTLYTKTEASPSINVSSVGGSGITTKVGALVVVKDSGDVVFGVFVGDGLHRGKGYYGSGESFLWKYVKTRDELEVFRWTGKNGYVALCEAEFLSFGGGDGTYGLYIDSTLLEGSSAPCPTFGNPPLCAVDTPGSRKGRTVTFECVGLEVWGVGP